MKNNIRITLLLILIGLGSFTVVQSQNKKGQASVNRVQGKYVFVMSEPVLDYEVIDDLGTGGTTFLVGKQSIDDQISNMIKRALKRVKKGDIEDFDGIVTPDGKRGTLIKFKE